MMFSRHKLCRWSFALVFNQLNGLNKAVVTNLQIVNSRCEIAHVDGIAVFPFKIFYMVTEYQLPVAVGDVQIQEVLVHAGDLQPEFIPCGIWKHLHKEFIARLRKPCANIQGKFQRGCCTITISAKCSQCNLYLLAYLWYRYFQVYIPVRGTIHHQTSHPHR